MLRTGQVLDRLRSGPSPLSGLKFVDDVSYVRDGLLAPHVAGSPRSRTETILRHLCLEYCVCVLMRPEHYGRIAEHGSRQVVNVLNDILSDGHERLERH